LAEEKEKKVIKLALNWFLNINITTASCFICATNIAQWVFQQKIGPLVTPSLQKL